MTLLLSPRQVEAYKRDGFVFPVDVLTSHEVKEFRGELQAWEQARGSLIDFPEKSKSYLLFNWADQLVHHPKILDAVQDLIGPDILVYHSTLFLKEANTPAYVRWHQDSTYFYLQPHLHVTAWVALSDASVQAGCMRALPGSHRWGAFEHDDKPEPMNMIRRGQGISERFDHETGTHDAGVSRADVASPHRSGPCLGRQRQRRQAHRLRHQLHPCPCPAGGRHAALGPVRAGPQPWAFCRRAAARCTAVAAGA
jgi:hypothetical protein